MGETIANIFLESYVLSPVWNNFHIVSHENHRMKPWSGLNDYLCSKIGKTDEKCSMIHSVEQMQRGIDSHLPDSRGGNYRLQPSKVCNLWCSHFTRRIRRGGAPYSRTKHHTRFLFELGEEEPNKDSQPIGQGRRSALLFKHLHPVLLLLRPSRISLCSMQF